MYLSVTHTTEYSYGQPLLLTRSTNSACAPLTTTARRCSSSTSHIEPKAVVRSQRDLYGHLIHHFHLPADHTSLRITASSRVVTYAVPEPHPVSAKSLPELRHRFFDFLAPTERVPLNRNWFTTFGALPLEADDELVSYLDNLTIYLNGHFIYQSDVTRVDTPLAEFAEKGRGVCQDYAHAMLAVCRSAGIPSRYVSGYVHSNPRGDESMLGGEGSHAWIEAYLPWSGWLGFDPTNGCRVGEAHVKNRLWTRLRRHPAGSRVAPWRGR